MNSFHDLQDEDAFTLERTDDIVWVKDDDHSASGNAFELDNPDNRIYVNPIETVKIFEQ